MWISLILKYVLRKYFETISYIYGQLVKHAAHCRQPYLSIYEDDNRYVFAQFKKKIITINPSTVRTYVLLGFLYKITVNILWVFFLFNPFYHLISGQWECEPCRAGFYCLPVDIFNASQNLIPCPEGYYCPVGTGKCLFSFFMLDDFVYGLKYTSSDVWLLFNNKFVNCKFFIYYFVSLSNYIIYIYSRL